MNYQDRRDHLAALAMQSLIAMRPAQTDAGKGALAREAYELADAMLYTRSPELHTALADKYGQK